MARRLDYRRLTRLEGTGTFSNGKCLRFCDPARPVLGPGRSPSKRYKRNKGPQIEAYNVKKVKYDNSSCLASCIQTSGPRENCLRNGSIQGLSGSIALRTLHCAEVWINNICSSRGLFARL